MRFLFLLALFISLIFENSFAQNKTQILVAYYSQSGNTKILAEKIAEGAQAVDGITVKLLPIEQVNPMDLLESDGIIVGSPVYNSQIAPPVMEFINSWPFEGRHLQGKVGAAFATGGGISIGEEGVMLSILQSMLIHGLVVMGGDQVESAFGASAITGEGPFSEEEMDELFLKKGFGLGKRVAEMSKKMKR